MSRPTAAFSILCLASLVTIASARMTARARAAARLGGSTAKAAMPKARAARAERAEQTFAAPWMASLKKALQHGGTQRAKRDRSDAKRKQVQLATVDPHSGRPAVRTVVFRGFLPQRILECEHGSKDGAESCVLQFITDRRAEKVRHLSEGASFVECCWWLDEAGVQYRISGRAVLATLASDDETLRAACEATWERIASSTRRTFAWASPGTPAADDSAVPMTEAQQEAEARENFVLVLVLPERVDELRLGGQQARRLYTLEDEATMSPPDPAQWRQTRWRELAVNP